MQRELDTPNLVCQYNAKTGELGAADEWCYVPEQFRKWMVTKVPTHFAPLKTDTTYDSPRHHSKPVR